MFFNNKLNFSYEMRLVIILLFFKHKTYKESYKVIYLHI